MDRECYKCVYHTNTCTKWGCQFETLEEHDKQIREHIVNQCIFIVRRNSSNGYRDIDGDWVEPSCNTRDVIDEMEQLKEHNMECKTDCPCNENGKCTWVANYETCKSKTK